MLKEYLVENYGFNEPIFLNEIQLDGVNDNALRQSFKRMVKSGNLIRFDNGIYYLPKTSKLLNKSYLDPLKVIIRKYIKNDTDTYGYFAGATFANQLRLTTQMPAVLEIITNKEATNGRTITIGGQTIRLKRPAVTITQENAELLQFLDAVSQYDKYAELSAEAALEVLKQYARAKEFSQSQLEDSSAALTGAAAKKLITGGIIYEFTSR